MGMIRWGALALWAASVNWAATLPYQGLATDAKGNPKSDKAYAVDFALYSVPSGGTALWSESQSLVTSKGLFSTSLGLTSDIPDSLFKGPLYLGVGFDGGSEGGRALLGTTPWAKLSDTANFARRAARADSVPGLQDSLASMRLVSFRLGLKERSDSSTAAKGLIDSSRALRDSITTLRMTVSSLVAYLAPATASPWKAAFAYGGLLDERDGQFYRTVVIGKQTWMAQNLNYAGKYRNIGVCAGNLPSNCDKYARQYTFVEALALDDTCLTKACADLIAPKHRGVCPTAWHVPSEEEWDSLARFVDPAAVLASMVGVVSVPAGNALKSAADWTTTGGTDSYGFRALPAGGYGTAPGASAAWWVAREVGATLGFRWEIRTTSDLVRYAVYKTSGTPSLVPVRCLKD